jgi:hypothetical protein
MKYALALALLLAAAAPRVARADEAEAARRFQEGVAAYARHDFRVAAHAFEAADAAEPSGAALYNAGLSWEEAGTPAKAAEDYDQALALGGLSAVQTRDAKRRLAQLSPRLGVYRVAAPPGARLSIDGGEPTKAGIPRYVAPGGHTLEVTFDDGRRATQQVAVAAGAVATAAFTAPPPDAGAPAPGAAAAPEPAPSSGSPVRTAGFVVLGAGVVAGGVAVGLGVEAIGARNTFNTSGYTDAAAHDRAATFRTATNVTIAVAGALGVAGLVMVLVPSRASSAPAASLQVGPGAVSVRARF